MQVDVNGTSLWFDVEGPALVPDSAGMRRRPTILLLHGGPGSYDHSYFKPHFTALTPIAQVVHLDLRDHGRSGRGDPSEWSFETCADDLPAFCRAIGIERPILLGHSMGGFVAILAGARRPDFAGGLVLVGTAARFDLDRLVEAVRAAAGDQVAELARRDYGGEPVADDAWARVFAAFGPHVPDAEALARRIRNPAVATVGMERMRHLDLLDQLPRIAVRTLVLVGDRDGVMPPAASREIVDGLPPGIGRLEVLEGVGHFPWLDDPDRFFASVGSFVRDVAGSAAEGQASAR
jgi:proline iminopeptidase